MKQKESLTAFKKAINSWNLHNCPDLNYDFLGLCNVFSEAPYIEGLSHMETRQLTCNSN